ncbi:MAG: hypothetical protein HZA93_01120 [Verrucomicrobia bacterium]|nr:hypothetical protein [Verrucomicrobiota bacterium]
MTRAQLEHIVRAAGAITDEPVILVLGSQSILGAFPSAPPPLDVSREADVCPMYAPEKADLISGAIGEISQFDSTFGYYAHGLPPEACPLPMGWKDRLVSFQNDNTRGITALCLHPLDLACSKLVAGREKDVGFVVGMLAHGLIEAGALEAHIGRLPTQEQRDRAVLMLTVVRSKMTSS